LDIAISDITALLAERAWLAWNEQGRDEVVHLSQRSENEQVNKASSGGIVQDFLGNKQSRLALSAGHMHERAARFPDLKSACTP
jgi:hypothetical protein